MQRGCHPGVSGLYSRPRWPSRVSNRGVGAIDGVRAPIAGRVSMDLVTLDVTDVAPSALEIGADIEFIGDTIPLEEIAAAANTASYEILTSLARRVPRHYEAGG